MTEIAEHREKSAQYGEKEVETKLKTLKWRKESVVERRESSERKEGGFRIMKFATLTPFPN